MDGEHVWQWQIRAGGEQYNSTLIRYLPATCGADFTSSSKFSVCYRVWLYLYELNWQAEELLKLPRGFLYLEGSVRGQLTSITRVNPWAGGGGVVVL